MVDISFLDKFKIIYDFIKSNSLILLILLLIITIILDLLYGNNKKSTKSLYIIIICLLVIYMLFSYYKPFINIFDIYIENVFKVAYFPSIIDYVTMILITVGIQLLSIKKCSGIHKHINIWIGVLIEVLFIINLIAMNNIKVDLINVTSIYENNLLLSIFQLTGITFIIWLIFNIFIGIIRVFLDKRIEMPKLNEY